VVLLLPLVVLLLPPLVLLVLLVLVLPPPPLLPLLPLLVLLELSTHWPFVHTLPALHALPQAPQLLVEPTSASQPLAGLLSQSAQPGLQAPIAHAPCMQAAPAWAGAQVLPQAPQFSTVLSDSQPFCESPSQLAEPAGQGVSWQQSAPPPVGRDFFTVYASQSELELGHDQPPGYCVHASESFQLSLSHIAKGGAFPQPNTSLPAYWFGAQPATELVGELQVPPRVAPSVH
jgi:hypothetical protein